MFIKNIVLAEVNKEGYRNEMYPSAHYSTGDILDSLDLLSLAYIGAQIRKKYNVKIIQQGDEPNEKLLKEILKEHPDVVGFTVYTFTAPNTQKICKKIKEYNPKIITVVGGYHPSGYPQIVKDKNIDFAVIGEGEITFKELLRALESNQSIEMVNGIAYWDKGLKITKPRERIKDLDDLLFPCREKGIMKETRVVGISYSRGCPFKCAFCDSYKIWGRGVAWRSAKNVVKEMKKIQKTYNKDNFRFTDLNFNINRKKVYELCDEIKRKKLNIKYYAMCNIQGMDGNILKKMKESGCVRIQYGIESFDNKFLKEMGKGGKTFSEIKRILNLTTLMGINASIFLMIGYPEDNKKNLDKVVKKIRELYKFKKTKTRPGKVAVRQIFPSTRVTFFTPFPTLPIYEKCRENGSLLTQDFSKYTTDIPIIKCGIPPKTLIKIREKILSISFRSWSKYSANN